MGYRVSLTLIALLFSVAMIWTGILAIKKKRYPLFVKTMVIYVLSVFFLLVQPAVGLRIQVFVLALALLAIAGHIVVGNFFNYYHRSRHFDRYWHALGSLAFSLLGYSVLKQAVSHSVFRVVVPKPYTAVVVPAIGISLGCLFEIYEFILDSVGRPKTKHQHGLTDTNFDLIANVIGAVIAGIVSVFVSL